MRIRTGLMDQLSLKRGCKRISLEEIGWLVLLIKTKEHGWLEKKIKHLGTRIGRLGSREITRNGHALPVPRYGCRNAVRFRRFRVPRFSVTSYTRSSHKLITNN